MTHSVDELRSMQSAGNYRGLIFALSDPDPFTRAEAMSRLTKFPNDQVFEAARRALGSDPDFSVRTQACVVLRGFPKTRLVVDTLKEALRDNHRLVRSKAAFALAHLRAREALEDLLVMKRQGIEPDIEDTISTSIEILEAPDKSETLLKLVDQRDVEGIGKLFDCMLGPDHKEVESGLASRGKNRMLDVFRVWESEGRLTALRDDPQEYVHAKETFAKKLIEACE